MEEPRILFCVKYVRSFRARIMTYGTLRQYKSFHQHRTNTKKLNIYEYLKFCILVPSGEVQTSFRSAGQNSQTYYQHCYCNMRGTREAIFVKVISSQPHRTDLTLCLFIFPRSLCLLRDTNFDCNILWLFRYSTEFQKWIFTSVSITLSMAYGQWFVSD